MTPLSSTSAADPHVHLARTDKAYRPPAAVVENTHTFLQPDISTTGGTAEQGLAHETKHTGVAAGRRVFVGPSFEGQGRRERPRAGSISRSPAVGGAGAGGEGKERAREVSEDSSEGGSGFLPWRKRQASASTSRKPTGETVPPSASSSRKTSAAAQLQTWTGSSFEIGGDVREAARRRDERIKQEREKREEEEKCREEERRRVVSAPADGLLAPLPLKSILRGKDEPSANGTALGRGHPSSVPSTPAHPDLSVSPTLDRPALTPRGTSVRFPASLEPHTASGAQPPLPPSVVLARHDSEADAAPASYPPPPPRPRERSDDVIKTARMLVRTDWTARDDLPDKFDEHVARKFPTATGEGWEELGVVWRRGGWIELWGEYKFNLAASFLSRKKLKAVIPLRPKSTHLSLYSSTDLVFCLTHRPNSRSVFSRTSSSTPAAPTPEPTQAVAVREDDEDEKDGRRPRHAKASKRAYVHLRSSGTNIFLFRARTQSASKQWLWELHLALGGVVPRVVEVSVPGLGAKVRLPVPHVEREDGDGETWAPLRPQTVVERCIEQLARVREWKEVVEDAKRQGAEFRLAWRRGSILDWIREDDVACRDWAVIGGGVAFRQEGQLEPVLELRPATHYPTTCRIPASQGANPSSLSSTVRISEPPGMEGFLVRHRPNGTPERVYLSSRMGLLFLCRPSTAHPPEPPLSTQETVNNPAALVLAPFVYGMASLAAPSKRKKTQLLRRVSDREGLRKSSTMSLKQERRRDWTVKSLDAVQSADTTLERRDEELDEKGGDAFLEWLEAEERKRGFLQITDARGFVNLSEVDSVEAELSDDHDAKERWLQVEDLGGDAGLKTAEDKARLRKMRCFVVKMRSGKTVRFECHSIRVRAEWVDRLRALATYWRRRERVDAIQLMELSPSSGLVNRLPPPSTSARRHAYDGAELDDDGEPPLTRNEILSSPHLAHFYNWCIIEGCRALMKQAVMHVKAGLRGTYRLRHVLLLPGTLVEYQSIARDMHGQPLSTPYHRRRLIVSLRDCYVYSGSLASHFLSAANSHSWDPGNEAGHQFPRCYPATDGLRTADEAEDCTFVVVRIRHGGNGKNRKLAQKAAGARIYRARSKLERDQFVYALNASIERLHRGEQKREQRLRDFTWLT
ncbi:hypothetical protein JCM10213v2_003033 [Rhodosporidiobolus nylandii]